MRSSYKKLPDAWERNSLLHHVLKRAKGVCTGEPWAILGSARKDYGSGITRLPTPLTARPTLGAEGPGKFFLSQELIKAYQAQLDDQEDVVGYRTPAHWYTDRFKASVCGCISPHPNRSVQKKQNKFP